MPVLAVLLGVLALLFAMERHPRLGRVFKVIPLLIAALAIGSTAIATFLAERLPDIGNIVRHFT